MLAAVTKRKTCTLMLAAATKRETCTPDDGCS
jgi:hypothetical protein